MKVKLSDSLLLSLILLVLIMAPLGFCPDNDFVIRAVIDPLVGGAIIGGGLNLIGGAINNQVNRSNMNYQAKISKQLMDYQWDRFQSYPAQVSSMASAGLNPATMFNNGGSRSASPSVAMPSSNPIDMGFSGNNLAEIALAASQAKKSGAEASGQLLNNKLLSETLEERIKQVALENNWTAENTAKLTTEIGLMSGQFNMLQQKIDNLRSEKKLTDKHVDWFERQMTAEINELQSSAKYKNAVADLTDQQKELLTRSMEDLVNINNLNAENLNQVVGLLKKYGDAQAVVGMLTQLIGSASDLMGAFMKIPKIKDFLSNKD